MRGTAYSHTGPTQSGHNLAGLHMVYVGLQAWVCCMLASILHTMYAFP